ncbi:HPr family phosphocarrier protein [Candidatus Saccharibacteria bacterium]|nr:HPr family phosphocarrier protein [Candidatus Saccharibacteria bacterium]
MERHITVKAEDGLHARPAAVLAKIAVGLDEQVTIVTEEGKTASASSILELMTSDIKCGDAVTLISGSDTALSAVEAALSNPEL